MKMFFHCKLLYSSITALTQSSASLQAITSQYKCGASVVRNNAICSVLSTGELLAPTEGVLRDVLGPIPVVLGLDPSDNLGSSSGQVGGMPLFGQLDLHSGICVGMGSDGELSSVASKSFP